MLWLCLLIWAVSRADAFEMPLQKGTIEWGLMTDYGLSNSLGASKPGIDFVTLLPRFGYVFAELGEKPPWKGSLQAVVEAVPVLVAFEASQTIYGGGFNLLLRYDIATGTRLVPFLEGVPASSSPRRNRRRPHLSFGPRNSTSPCRSLQACDIFSASRPPSASNTASITSQTLASPKTIQGSTRISSYSAFPFSGKPVSAMNAVALIPPLASPLPLPAPAPGGRFPPPGGKGTRDESSLPAQQIAEVRLSGPRRSR